MAARVLEEAPDHQEDRVLVVGEPKHSTDRGTYNRRRRHPSAALVDRRDTGLGIQNVECRHHRPHILRILWLLCMRPMTLR
eukprot:3129349-Amphidinium_carterae.1